MSIIVTGDCLRPHYDSFTPHQTANIIALHLVLTNNNINVDKVILPTQDSIIPYPEWAKTQNRTSYIPWHISNRLITANDMVIGFELPHNLISYMKTNNIKYLDIIDSPYRYANKEYLVNTNFLNIKPIPGKYPHKLKDYEQIDGIADGTTLIVGQTAGDRSLLSYGRLLDLPDFQDVILKYNKCLFKPHPNEPNRLVDYYRQFNIAHTNECIYRLLSTKQITHVVGISSSVLYEAEVFKKSVTRLYNSTKLGYIRTDLVSIIDELKGL